MIARRSRTLTSPELFLLPTFFSNSSGCSVISFCENSGGGMAVPCCTADSPQPGEAQLIQKRAAAAAGRWHDLNRILGPTLNVLALSSESLTALAPKPRRAPGGLARRRPRGR